MEFTALPLVVRVIYQMVEARSRVLDLGCGKGELLQLLIREKEICGQGIEFDNEAIHQCVEKGISVLYGDIEKGLSEYPNQSFDYVLLNESLQEVRNVHFVIGESLRVARKTIVVFPNFAHYRSRLKLFFSGTAPVTASLPHRWYQTPNVRFFSILDFQRYCQEKKITILEAAYLAGRKQIRVFPNLFAEFGVFLITQKIVEGYEENKH